MSPLQLGNRDLMRAMNRSIVLNVIKTLGPIARADVARRTGLSPATVTGITADLIQEELVFEKATGDSSGGRPGILLAVNPSGGYVFGAKLTETAAIGALTDLEASLIARQSAPLPSQAPDEVVQAIAGLVTGLLAEAGVPQRKLLGIGIGLAGVVDSQRGVLRTSPFFGWRDLPLGDLLQDKFNVPVTIDNDVNTLTQAERWFGSGQGVDHFLVITVGRGIGMGIVTNGQFYRGAGGGAGEFGHTAVNDDQTPCECGRSGCLDAVIGERGLLRRASTLPDPPETIEELITRAQKDPAAAEILAGAGTILGQAIGNLVNVFNPQKIILGGEGVRMGSLFFDPLRRAVERRVVPALYADLTIQLESWGNDAWARGAASLVLRNLFESPIYQSPVETA